MKAASIGLAGMLSVPLRRRTRLGGARFRAPMGVRRIVVRLAVQPTEARLVELPIVLRLRRQLTATVPQPLRPSTAIVRPLRPIRPVRVMRRVWQPA